MHGIIWVGLGGFAGAILRYLISGWVQNLTQSVAFPYGTLAVNLAGCFLIGIMAQLVQSQAGVPAELRLLLMVGLLGSFTTYSTFSNETFILLQDNKIVPALLNVTTHLIVGLAAVMLGRFTLITLWR